MNQHSDRERDVSVMHSFDWDFSASQGWEIEEIIACCHYEFARESPTLVAHLDEGQMLDIQIGLTYRANVGGRLCSLPNPLLWPWSRSLGLRFASTPWQTISEEYRRKVSASYGRNAYPFHSAFIAADSPSMAAKIMSRGDARKGIDHKTGIERIAVEIDWAAFDDAEIMSAFKVWVRSARPDAIGWRIRQGRGKVKDWRAKLNRLAVMRLLHHSTLRDLPKRCPKAWKWIGTGGEWRRKATSPKELYETGQSNQIFKLRKKALSDFHELFPFLSSTEMPRSWETSSKTDIRVAARP